MSVGAQAILIPVRHGCEDGERVCEGGADDLAALATQDLSDNGLGDGLWLEFRHQKRGAVAVTLEQGRARVPLVDDDSAHLSRPVAGCELSREALVKSKGCVF